MTLEIPPEQNNDSPFDCLRKFDESGKARTVFITASIIFYIFSGAITSRLMVEKHFEVHAILLLLLVLFSEAVAFAIVVRGTLMRARRQKPFIRYGAWGLGVLLILPMPFVIGVASFNPPTLDKSKAYCDRVLLPQLENYRSQHGKYPSSISMKGVPSNVLYNYNGSLLVVTNPFESMHVKEEWHYSGSEAKWELITYEISE